MERESRNRILEAAARVYAEAGFRGATTRRIADEAGVNEITIFRQFGSKAALIDEAIRARAGMPGAALPPLPAEPRDPECELTAWCAAHLEQLRISRSLIRKSMGDVEERPAAGPCTTAPTLGAAQELKAYMIRLRERGLVDWGKRGAPGTERARCEIAHAAGAMLMASLFGDAMGRDFMPEMYPQPPERAAELYVRLFLRAIGASAADGRRAPFTPPRRAPDHEPPPRSASPPRQPSPQQAAPQHAAPQLRTSSHRPTPSTKRR